MPLYHPRNKEREKERQEEIKSRKIDNRKRKSK